MKRAKRKSAKKSAGRKKAAKKAAGKKKGAKKAASKKKAAKKGGSASGKKELVVIDPAVPLGEDKRHLSKKNHDQIQWKNLDKVTHWVRFVPNRWPFPLPQHDVEVPTTGNRRSEVLTVRAGAPKGPYLYTIVPKVVYGIPGTPPDGPAVIVED